jgi:hypothetical protein
LKFQSLQLKDEGSAEAIQSMLKRLVRRFRKLIEVEKGKKDTLLRRIIENWNASLNINRGVRASISQTTYAYKTRRVMRSLRLSKWNRWLTFRVYMAHLTNSLWSASRATSSRQRTTRNGPSASSHRYGPPSPSFLTLSSLPHPLNPTLTPF